MAIPQTSSRLQLLQARFQQKQLEEKEQKLLQLYDQQQQRAHQVAQRGSAGSNGSLNDVNNTAVKTRQMFAERRQNQKAKGIDKSYPLEPLESSNKRANGGSSKQNFIKAGQSGGSVSSRKHLADENRRDVNSNRQAHQPASSRSYQNNNSSPSSQVARKGFSNDTTAPGHKGEQQTDGASIERQKQSNGNRYEINIDEVIDNDAMERNRMVARYSMESEVRHGSYNSQASRVVESARYSEKILNDVSNTQMGQSSVAVVSVPKASNRAEVKTEMRSRNSSITRHDVDTKKPVNLDSILNKKSQSNGKTSDNSLRKSFSVYTPLRNVENYNEQQNNQLSSRNSSSLKFLNKIVESQSYANENKPTPAPRKSSIGGSGDLDEKPLTPAARRFSSGSTAEISRSSPNASLRSSPHDKAKLNTAKPDSGIGDSLTTCKICKRRFNSERINLHEQICAKTAQKKRKQFDATTQRVRGTELEDFVTKPATNNNKKQAKNGKSDSKPSPASSKSNWRRKHEDFINAIRSAKQVQAHLNAGGKLSDLPPPPPSDTSDYIKCPHCSRKFNQAAAERHIPKCENMQHNKGPSRPSRAPLKANSKR